MGYNFFGANCMLPDGCNADHWRFIVMLVIRLFLQFHIFWVFLCYMDKLKKVEKVDVIVKVEKPAAKVIVKMSGELTLTVKYAEIYETCIYNNPELDDYFKKDTKKDGLTSAVIVTEQSHAIGGAWSKYVDKHEILQTHVSETVECKAANGKFTPIYNSDPMKVKVTDCTKPFPARIGCFEDTIGTCNLYANKWRDGIYKDGETVGIEMNNELTIYVVGTWVNDPEEIVEDEIVNDDDEEANLLGNKKSDFEELEASKDK